MDVWKTLELTLASRWSRLIPFVGWMKGLVIHAIHGNIGMVLLYAVLTVAGMAAFIYVIWHMKADFYEDAMAGAQQRSEILQAAAENRKVIQTNDSKSKKKEKRKVKEDVTLKGEGAVLFFTKEVHCRKRLARFGFVTNTMLVYLLIFVVITLLGPKLWETEFVSDYCFEISGFVVMTILFFRTLGNPIQQETSMNWLFLVPENPYKKVFFAMVAGTYATFMDLLPGMIFASLILKVSIWKFLLWMAVFVTLDFMLSGVGVVIEALLPETALNQVKAAIQMMLKFFMILVVVVAVVVGVLLQGLTLGLLITLLTNIILGGVAFIIYPSLLHDGMA
jgi:hypothetical protein